MRPGSLGRVVGAVACVACASPAVGCISFQSTRNAPGVADIKAPPRDPSSHTVEVPRDPGEHVLLWNAGAMGGGGVSIANEASSKATASVSFSGETSVHFGWSDRTHEGIGPLLVPDPGISVGANLGWTLAPSGRVSTNAGYAELQVSNSLLYSLAGGWAYDVDRKESGPQATLTVGPFYARSTTILSAGTAVEVGIVFKLPVVVYQRSR